MLVPVAVTLCLLSLSHLSADASEEKLPSFAEPVKNVTATKGRDATLVCVTENLGNYKVAWVKVDTQTILTIGSHLITRNYQISLTQSDDRVWNLRISNVDRHDTGWYMCQINTDPMRSQMGYLEVVEPPDIVLHDSSEDLLVDENETTRLRCVARGYPEPTITWHREGGDSSPLRSSPGVTINGTDITFSPVKRYHMAVYLCVASNGVPPSVSKRIVLQVQFPPLVNVTSQLLSAAQGTAVTLQCDTESYPSSVAYWTKANAGLVLRPKYQMSVSESGYKKTMWLKILKVDGTDFTTYKCVVKNAFGEAYGTIRLTERQPTPEERMAMRSKTEDDHLRLQRKEAAAREAARRREQRRREEESRRQRDRQRQQNAAASDRPPEQRLPPHTGVTSTGGDRTERPGPASSSAGAGRPVPLTAPAGLLLLPPLLPLLLGSRAVRH